MADNNQEDNNNDPLKDAFGGISKGWKKFLSDSASSISSKSTSDNKQNFNINTFFSSIRKNETKAILKTIEQENFDIDSYNRRGYTALHIAAQNDSLEAAMILLENGADPLLHKKDDPSRTPLEIAANYNKPKIVEFLARNGGYSSGHTTDGWSLLHRSCEKDRSTIVEALINAGADCNEKTGNGSTPLLIAIAQHKTNTAKVLLKFPAVFKTLNDNYVATDKDKRKALHWALENDDLELIKIMISKGANINIEDATGKTPLFYAIDSGNIEIIKLIIEYGGDVNYNSEQYGSSLLYASNSKALRDEEKAEVIKILINHGADAEIKGPRGKTPLHALVNETISTTPINSLLQYPINKDLTDIFGTSALMEASMKSSKIDDIGEIIKAGANLNLRHKKDASTALIQATKAHNIKAVKALLSLGANPKLYDCYNKSALSYARENNSEAIIIELEKALKPLGKYLPFPSK